MTNSINKITIDITSTKPFTGKTLVSSIIARALADAGFGNAVEHCLDLKQDASGLPIPQSVLDTYVDIVDLNGSKLDEVVHRVYPIRRSVDLTTDLLATKHQQPTEEVQYSTTQQNIIDQLQTLLAQAKEGRLQSLVALAYRDHGIPGEQKTSQDIYWETGTVTKASVLGSVAMLQAKMTEMFLKDGN